MQFEKKSKEGSPKNLSRSLPLNIGRVFLKSANAITNSVSSLGESVKKRTGLLTKTQEQRHQEAIEQTITFKSRLLLNRLLSADASSLILEILEDFKDQSAREHPDFKLTDLFKKTRTTQEKDKQLQQQYALAMFIADKLQSEPQLAQILSEALCDAMTVDSRNNAHKTSESLEQDLAETIILMAGIFFRLETDPDISDPKQWEKIPLKQTEKRSPSPEIEQGSEIEPLNPIRFLKRMMQRLLSKIPSSVNKILGRNAQQDAARPESMTEMRSFQKFERQAFVLNHLHDLPLIVRFMNTLIKQDAFLIEHAQSPEEKNLLQKKHDDFIKGLYKFIKGFVINAEARESSMEWADVLVSYLRHEKEMSSHNPSIAEERRIARAHIMAMIVEHLLPDLSPSDQRIFCEELEKTVNNMTGLGDILAHLSPKLIGFLRENSSQPYTRTLVVTILNQLYGYTPEQIQIDIERNMFLRTKDTTESDRWSETSSETISSLSDKMLSHADLHKGGTHFPDALIDYVLNARTFTDKGLSELLAHIPRGETFELFEKIFCQKNPDSPDFYDTDIFDSLVSNNPAGLLRFISKILVQLTINQESLSDKSPSERKDYYAAEEELLTDHLCDCFMTHPEIAQLHLKNLTQGLADLSYGINHHDTERTHKGIIAIITLLPEINESVIQAEPPNILVKTIAAALWSIPSELPLEKQHTEKQLQIKILREMMLNLKKTIAQDPKTIDVIATLLSNKSIKEPIAQTVASLFQGSPQSLLQYFTPIVVDAISGLDIAERQIVAQRVPALNAACALCEVGRFTVSCAFLAMGGIEAGVNYALGNLFYYGEQCAVNMFSRVPEQFVPVTPQQPIVEAAVAEESCAKPLTFSQSKDFEHTRPELKF